VDENVDCLVFMVVEQNGIQWISDRMLRALGSQPLGASIWQGEESVLLSDTLTMALSATGLGICTENADRIKSPYSKNISVRPSN